MVGGRLGAIVQLVFRWNLQVKSRGFVLAGFKQVCDLLRGKRRRLTVLSLHQQAIATIRVARPIERTCRLVTVDTGEVNDIGRKPDDSRSQPIFRRSALDDQRFAPACQAGFDPTLRSASKVNSSAIVPGAQITIKACLGVALLAGCGR